MIDERKNPDFQKQLKTGQTANKLMQNSARPKISKKNLIILILFALFVWGFSYNTLKRLGVDEITSQILGILFGFFLVVVLEGVTRMRLSRLIG